MAEGGKGGDARVTGQGSAIGGPGGDAGIGPGKGGDGGHAVVNGDGFAQGGGGGSGPTPDGRGGRGAKGPTELAGGPTQLWPYGAGGSGANHPEYNRRLQLLKQICYEYCRTFPERVIYLEAQIERVPALWTNTRLAEMGEAWRVEMGPEGYVLPPLVR